MDGPKDSSLLSLEIQNSFESNRIRSNQNNILINAINFQLKAFSIIYRSIIFGKTEVFTPCSVVLSKWDPCYFILQSFLCSISSLNTKQSRRMMKMRNKTLQSITWKRCQHFLVWDRCLFCLHAKKRPKSSSFFSFSQLQIFNFSRWSLHYLCNKASTKLEKEQEMRKQH